MKRNLVFLTIPLLLAGASSCNPTISTPEKIQMEYGTRIGLDGDDVEGAMERISYDRLSTMIKRKHSFALLVHNSQSLCSCWTRFSENVLFPYIKAEGFLFYECDYQEFLSYATSDEARFGLSLYEGSETIGIFSEGELKYQHDNVDENASWTTDYSTFASWMNSRTSPSRVRLVNQDQLDALYADASLAAGFSVYFTRHGCGDCSYLDTHDLYQWQKDNPVTAFNDSNTLFAIDADVPGIRYEEDGKTMNQTTYSAFKEEYGLTYDAEKNPVGFDNGDWNGAFPTIYHIHPGQGKTGDAIDAAGVFYNDWPDKETGLLTETSTYFNSAHLSLDALSYLNDTSLEHKNLVGVNLGKDLKDNHEALAPYHGPILDALLDAILL